jgi:hypothetical protein
VCAQASKEEVVKAEFHYDGVLDPFGFDMDYAAMHEMLLDALLEEARKRKAGVSPQSHHHHHHAHPHEHVKKSSLKEKMSISKTRLSPSRPPLDNSMSTPTSCRSVTPLLSPASSTPPSSRFISTEHTYLEPVLVHRLQSCIFTEKEKSCGYKKCEVRKLLGLFLSFV